MSLHSYNKKWQRRLRRLISRTSDIIAKTPYEHVDTSYLPEVDVVVLDNGETFENFNLNLRKIADAAEEATRGPSEGMVTRSIFRRLNNQLARLEPYVVAKILTSVHPCLRSIASLRTVNKAFLQCSYFAFDHARLDYHGRLEDPMPPLYDVFQSALNMGGLVIVDLDISLTDIGDENFSSAMHHPSARKIESLSISGCESLTFNSILRIMHISGLLVVDLSSINVDAAAIADHVVQNCLFLEHLNISVNTVAEESLSAFLRRASSSQSLRSLIMDHLDIYTTGGVDEDHHPMLNLDHSRLTHLSITGTDISAYDLLCVPAQNVFLSDLRKDDLFKINMKMGRYVASAHQRPKYAPTVINCEELRQSAAVNGRHKFLDKLALAKFSWPLEATWHGEHAFAGTFASCIQGESSTWVEFWAHVF